MVTMVLVLGAGDTADVWSKVQDALPVSSLALDLLGRGRNPSDLSRVTVDLAVRQAVTDIVEQSSGPIVLVGHSMGGAVSPGVLARLGERVVHLVHIAAVAGAQGELPLAVASMEFADLATTFPTGLRAMDDRGALARIDSLNLGCTPTSWAAEAPTIPRTYIQPLRDRIYPPDAQKRLAAALHADEVVPLDVGHNVARSSPRELAGILSGVATRHL